MKRLNRHTTHILSLALIVVIGGLFFPQTAHANPLEILTNFIGWAISPIGQLLLTVTSLITMLGGAALNYTIDYTVVNMSQNYSKMPAINEVWKVMRDLSNMVFIFILLYAAIQTILGIGGDNKKLIVNTVIVAVLINFSLFFTQIIIDASNILAVTFYDAIVPGKAAEGLGSIGLSDTIVNLLGVHTLFNASGQVNGATIATIGIIGSVVLLISAFVFFAAALLLIIRYAVLILVIVLSPIAFVAHVFPQLDQYRKQWWEALLGQAFFAPILFLLLWVSIYILQGMGGPNGDFANAIIGTTSEEDGSRHFNPGAIPTLVNFAIVIVFMIASIVIAKKWADRAGGGMNKLTSMATRAAGKASFGLAGVAGRRTLGAAGAALGDAEFLKKRADKAGLVGAASRLALATSRKTSKASFDVRATGLGTTLGAGKAQKGGFAETVKQEAKKKEEFAKSLAPSEVAINKAKEAVNNAKTPEEKAQAQARLDQMIGNKKKIDERVANLEKEKKTEVASARDDEELKAVEAKERSANDTVSRLETEAEAAEGALKDSKLKKLEVAKNKLEEVKKEAIAARQRVREEIEDITANYDEEIESLKKTEIDPAKKVRGEQYASALEDPRWIRSRFNPNIVISRSSRQAAEKIRDGKKSVKDLVDEALKASGDKPAEEKPKEGEEDEEAKT